MSHSPADRGDRSLGLVRPVRAAAPRRGPGWLTPRPSGRGHSVCPLSANQEGSSSARRAEKQARVGRRLWWGRWAASLSGTVYVLLT